MGKNTEKVSTAKRKAPSAKKVIITCAKCGREFVTEVRTRPPKHCEACATPSGTWKVIGFEDSPFGKVRVEQKGEKIRKILVE